MPILTEPILAMLVLIRAHAPLHLFFNLIGLRIYNFRLVVNHFFASVIKHVSLPLLHDGRLFSRLGLAFVLSLRDRLLTWLILNRRGGEVRLSGCLERRNLFPQIRNL